MIKFKEWYCKYFILTPFTPAMAVAAATTCWLILNGSLALTVLSAGVGALVIVAEDKYLLN